METRKLINVIVLQPQNIDQRENQHESSQVQYFLASTVYSFQLEQVEIGRAFVGMVTL